MRLLIAAAVLLCLSMTLPIMWIRAQPYETESLLNTFGQPEDCRHPCWQSIRPGETERSDALHILEHSPWAAQIISDPAWLHWQWAAAGLPYIDPQVPGAIRTDEDAVVEIHLGATATVGDFFLVFGQPGWATAWHSGTETTLILSYPEDSLSLIVNLACPIKRHSFWMARPAVRIHSVPVLSTDLTASLIDRSLSC